MEHPKPILVVSKCLGFDKCRWNGVTIPDPVVETLKPHVQYKPVCPEVEIGLGVPRDPIRIVRDGGKLRLYQPSAKKDVTEKMENFAYNFLENVGEIDGFILKFKSPSCGLKGVKIYPKGEKVGSIDTGSGFFGAEVLKRFPLHPIEDEGRLKNFGIREHFLTKLFAFTHFRLLKQTGKMGEIVKFHADNKFLLMAYSQKELKSMGKIVANHEKRPFHEVFTLYESSLYRAFLKPPRVTNTINVLMHALGYFSKELKSNEKKYFLETLEKFRNKKIPVSVPVAILKSYIARFGQDYLEQQTFFEPYPEELVEVTDSGKGRDIGR